MRWGMTARQDKLFWNRNVLDSCTSLSSLQLDSGCSGHRSTAGLSWKTLDRHSCDLLSQVPCITSVHLVVCVEWIIQNCGPVERCTLNNCIKCQEMKTPTSDQTNKSENCCCCLFSLPKTGTRVFTHHNYDWRPLHSAYYSWPSLSTGAQSKLPVCAGAFLLIQKASGSEHNRLLSQHLSRHRHLSHDSKIPQVTSKEACFHCAALALWPQIAIAGAVRLSDELDWRTWTGLRYRRTLHRLPCLFFWIPDRWIR